MLIAAPALSQVQSADSLIWKEDIKVLARPSEDSITLRWAPINFSAWQAGNKEGYSIERYTLIRGGELLPTPERVLLTEQPVKMLAESQWEPLMTRSYFAPIAAQAFFGERFEIDLGQSDIFTIVNKVKENEQRFAFALFAADMSVLVAKASGLWYTDKTIKKNEKYLYRITIGHATDSVRGNIFAGPGDSYYVPKPEDLKAEFKNTSVSLRWSKSQEGTFTAYIVERSEDGKSFLPISDIPITTVTPTEQSDIRYEYATDSIPDLTKTYFYRVKGITPFGEYSAASDVVQGKGTVSIENVPYITSADNIQNTSIQLTWDFPEKNNASIKGFTIERSLKPRGNFTSIVSGNLPERTRQFEDKSPQKVNYYQVTAHGLDGKQYRSSTYLAQLVDSIPPSPPVGLKAVIDEYGIVSLSWEPNKEEDIYGYRIYRANTRIEEQAQITTEPITLAFFSDRVNLNTLNDSVFYSLMAIDRNQNHSPLSVKLGASLPDKVKPQPPVFFPVISDEKGVALTWMKSSSLDVKHYEVFRKTADRREWIRLKIVQATIDDSLYRFADENAEAGKVNHYTVIAVDDAGLESEPASPVSGAKIDNKLQPSVTWKQPVIIGEQKQVVLSWIYDQKEVRSFLIYKAVDENPPVLCKSVSGDQLEFRDRLLPGQQHTYRIMAVFKNSSKSTLSEEIVVKY